MRTAFLPLLLLGGLAAAGIATSAPNPCASGNCTVTPPNAWAKVFPGLRTSVPLAYPRATQGAVLRTVRLSTPQEQPYDPQTDPGGDGIECGGAEITAVYRTPSGGRVTLTIGASENTSPGCGPSAPVGDHCATSRLAVAKGVTLSCHGAKGRRALLWSGPSWGYRLDAPAGFRITAMANSTR
jgi:hypothetical protein